MKKLIFFIFMLTILVSCNPIDGDIDPSRFDGKDSTNKTKVLNVSVNDVKH